MFYSVLTSFYNESESPTLSLFRYPREADRDGDFVKRTDPKLICRDSFRILTSSYANTSAMRHLSLLHACACMFFFSTINAISPIAYANDFINPDDILTKTLQVGASDHTAQARESIVEWAKDLAAKGPWSE